MREITVEQKEIKIISPRRTSIMLAGRKKRKGVTEREYRRMLNESALIISISMGVNIVQGIVIWILQAGPSG